VTTRLFFSYQHFQFSKDDLAGDATSGAGLDAPADAADPGAFHERHGV